MNDRLPKYYLLKQTIIEKIECEEYSINEPIPSERDLIETYGVSRITVRKAIDELVAEGYLYRVQGKGTFIKTDQYTNDLFSLSSCTNEVNAMGMIPGRKLLSLEVIKADKRLTSDLRLNEGQDVFRLKRIILADNQPLNLTTAYLPVHLFPQIEKYDFSCNSLYEIIRKHYGVKITRASRTVEAVVIGDEVSKALKVSKGTPVLLFRCVTYGIINNTEIPIESYKCWYRTDRLKFAINQESKR